METDEASFGFRQNKEEKKYKKEKAYLTDEAISTTC